MPVVERSLLRGSKRRFAAFIGFLCLLGVVVVGGLLLERCRRVGRQREIAAYLGAHDWRVIWGPNADEVQDSWWLRVISNTMGYSFVTDVTALSLQNGNSPWNGDLSRIPELYTLRVLCITSRKAVLTDDFLIGLSRLRHLDNVLLYSAMSDRQLYLLSRCPKLRKLIVDGSYLTPQSIAYFRRFPSLKELSICDSALAPKDRFRLKDSLPKCRVVFTNDGMNKRVRS